MNIFQFESHNLGLTLIATISDIYRHQFQSVFLSVFILRPEDIHASLICSIDKIGLIKSKV